MTTGSKTVLFVGDINVDLMMQGLESLPMVDREVSCTSFEVTLGSSAAICACAYASLGGSACFLGLAGEDAYGDFMVRGMEGFGIDTRRVRRTGQVGTGVTVNLIYGRTRTQVTYPGTIAEFDGAAVGPEDFEGLHHIHFAGPYLQDRFRPHLTRLIETAGRLGLTTSLDPQWDASETWAYLEEWLPLLDFLLLNEDEARSITGKDSVEEACLDLASRTACPIVKAGRRGAALCRNGAVEFLPTYQAEIVDTTGAGDSFNAGFLYALLEGGEALEMAVAFANAVGARSCTFAGGVNARSSRQDVLEFMRREYERS